MLTYPYHQSQSQSQQSGQSFPWLLLLLTFAWLWPGVFSHDLWRPAEPEIFEAMQEGGAGTLWLPTLFGKAYFEVSPLYLHTAMWFKSHLSPWLIDEFSATRFATVWFMSIAYISCGVAGHKFLGKESGRSVVLILLGSVGLWGMGHFLGDQSVLFAGLGLTLWAFSIVDRQVVFSAVLLSVGIMLISQAAGWLLALIPIIIPLLLYVISPLWRKKRYLIVWLVTQAILWPIVVVYFLILNEINSEFVQNYFDYAVFGSFGGIKQFNIGFHLHYYLMHLLWFAFPAYPLAIWTLTRLKVQNTQWGIFCLVWLGAGVVFLAVEPKQYQDELVWLLPVLAILGAAQLDSLRRGAAAFLNWFGMMTFGVAALFLWIGFFAMNYGFPAKLAERAAYFSPYYQPEIKYLSIIVALSFTPIWIYFITRRRIRGRQAVGNWAAGMTLVWALLMTLFLPWLDAAKSYRPIVHAMHEALSVDDWAALNGGACVGVRAGDYQARLAWKQYGLVPIKVDAQCPYQLYEVKVNEIFAKTGEIIWEGKRPRSKQNRFILTRN